LQDRLDAVAILRKSGAKKKTDPRLLSHARFGPIIMHGMPTAPDLEEVEEEDWEQKRKKARVFACMHSWAMELRSDGNLASSVFLAGPQFGAFSISDQESIGDQDRSCDPFIQAKLGSIGTVYMSQKPDPNRFRFGFGLA
jgi:hypothetical protein